MVTPIPAADVVVVGGGHNGLVAAAYLARAGRRVIVCEGRDRFGGAVAGERLFAGVDARLSRFSYLVSLLPARLVDELGLGIELRSRRTASYSPDDDHGLLVERPEGSATLASFRELTGSDTEYRAWQELYADLGRFSSVVAPTLTEPLRRAGQLRTKVGEALWDALTERPLGELIESRLGHDLVRGTVLTDGLIGTETDAHDQQLRQNRCFAYHVIGNGTGEWKVPVGGMGALADAFERVARDAGATLIDSTPVTELDGDAQGWRVRLADGRTLFGAHLLANCSDVELIRLLGETTTEPAPEGNQLKINMVLRRLPRLRSGLDPAVAFAGTLHVNQGYGQLAEAHRRAIEGRLPDPLPCEVYCHTLTDASILAPELAAAGWQTLTLFGLHTPAGLFADDPDRMRQRAERAALESLQSVLADPLEDCLAVDADGRPCVETMTPLDVQREVGMPGGHIFHGDLSWPWLSDDEPAETAAQRWGVATEHPGLLRCGSSSRRGGAVSGLGGHSAAMAVLSELTD